MQFFHSSQTSDAHTIQLYGLLNHENAKISKISTQKMEVMTRDMYKMTQKTQQETVSMRIITLVTLFFLPGTFICVSLSCEHLNAGPDHGNSRS